MSLWYEIQHRDITTKKWKEDFHGNSFLATWQMIQGAAQGLCKEREKMENQILMMHLIIFLFPLLLNKKEDLRCKSFFATSE